MKYLLIVFAFITTVISSAAAQEREGVNPNDVDSIDSVMRAYYEAVSGPPGIRDYKRILTLYLPNAKLNISTPDGELVHGIVEEVVMTKKFQTISTDFYEREISRDEQRFGDMANVISTYGISDAWENENYTARGVTVFQMRKYNGRWWIMSSMWQRESDDLPLPAHLLD
ncbi:hypothetical protein [Pseudemcibacter aquimaris]|uniref:hypothetical protein n=1 Tax=Pseudemcibacter aquimaris TaxID=2857064 RepID=UPI0020112579|nr:hypothetical protein [Pseudemcibacter aquimaris]MCC3859869.1 hypothetical protein [Pseudemcibacter aquimaris]WDU57201.1 hypothetical protein KW060_08320 [Pseudemcibacter aquimaris]